MVKRWRADEKVIVRVPWPLGAKVHRIDLTINDLVVKWEPRRVHLTVEFERKIRYLSATGTLRTLSDRITYQKELMPPPGLIRGQPLEVEATSLYLTVQGQGTATALEQGIGLSFAGWEEHPPAEVFQPAEQSWLILGKQLVARERFLHTETLYWPEPNRKEPLVEKALNNVEFSLTREGIHCQGELQLSFAQGPQKTQRFSVLIPYQIPAGAELAGEAELTDLKIVDGNKALLAVTINCCLLQEKPLPVKVAASGEEGDPFFLWRLRERKNREWAGTFQVNLPEQAKLLEEVTVAGARGWTVQEEKGLLCMGQILLELFYIDHQDQEKCYRLRIPWSQWLTAALPLPTVKAKPEDRVYRLEVKKAKAEAVGFAHGQVLTLFLQLAYGVTAAQKEKAVLPIPAGTGKTTTLLAEKLISEAAIEYYVEIPVTTPADFGESHHLWWRKGVERGETVRGGVLIRAQPTIIWQYRNKDHQMKVVEVKPVLDWFHPSPLVRPGQQAEVKIEAIALELQKDNRGAFRIQLLLSGRLTVTAPEIRTVELGGQPEPAEGLVLPPPKKAVLKWEEKLPHAVRQVRSAHFFLGPFHRIKTDELFLLEGEVKGEIIYLGKDGRDHHYRLKKALWASLPPAYSRIPVLVPVLTGWRCLPLPGWNWERGGVWCEIALDLLAFSSKEK